MANMASRLFNAFSPTFSSSRSTITPNLGSDYRYGIPIEQFIQEVRNGLPNAQQRLKRHAEHWAWYNFDNNAYLPRREAESEFDFEGRNKRMTGILHQCVEILCDHLYNPGPSRVCRDEYANSFLELVYEQNLFNHIMQHADILSTLNDTCAIQIDAGEGEWDNKPIELILWGGHEFHVWTHPHNARRPIAVVTLDKYDNYETRKLWFEDRVITFKTGRLYPNQTAGGRVAEIVADEKHNYGCIPFAFTHYELPLHGDFFPPGIGNLLQPANKSIDNRLSKLDESIEKHLNPIPIAEGVAPDWNPVIEPGRFLRIVPPSFSGITGDFSVATPQPRLSYLQVLIDVAGVWDDQIRYINQVLDAARVPLSYARMEQSGVTSGIALIVEQAPLLNRARKRRLPYGYYENEIAKTILTCAGNHYGEPRLVEVARDLVLELVWPEPEINIPGNDRDEADAFELQMGLTSKIMLLQKRQGLSRDQSIDRLKQVAEDREIEKELLGEQEPGSGTVVPPEQQQGVEGEVEGEAEGGVEEGSEDNASVTEVSLED